MKNLVAVLPLLAALHAFGESAVTNITILLAAQTNSASWDTTHTSISFACRATIDNPTHDPLTVTNLLQDHSGLSLKVTDKDGTELARLYAAPFKRSESTIDPGGKQSFYPYYGITQRFSVPGRNTTVKLQLEGKLSGSSYAGSLTSNIVELKIP
jgi:hypothetical protein